MRTKIESKVCFDRSTLDIIDVNRGRISRSGFINTVIQELFQEEYNILKGDSTKNVN